MLTANRDYFCTHNCYIIVLQQSCQIILPRTYITAVHDGVLRALIDKHLMKVAPTEDAKAQFKTAQRQWIKYRDEMVKAYAKDFGGQGERLAATLEVKLTRDQANYLQEYAEIFENSEE